MNNDLEYINRLILENEGYYNNLDVGEGLRRYVMAIPEKDCFVMRDFVVKTGSDFKILYSDWYIIKHDFEQSKKDPLFKRILVQPIKMLLGF